MMGASDWVVSVLASGEAYVILTGGGAPYSSFGKIFC
jgi:hypothetical protein